MKGQRQKTGAQFLEEFQGVAMNSRVPDTLSSRTVIFVTVGADGPTPDPVQRCHTSRDCLLLPLTADGSPGLQ
jgi:hypothetical protein